MPSASIYTLGCRLNQSETARLVDELTEAGYTMVPFGQPADVGIVNTCTVTGEADAKSRKAIRSFIRKNPDAVVAVIGCYSQMGADHIADIAGVDYVIGNDAKMAVLEMVATGKRVTPHIAIERGAVEPFTIPSRGTDPIDKRVNLKIQEGCNFNCSYCIVHEARGPARSRVFSDLVQEADHLVQRGVKEIVLTGVNLGTYDDSGCSLVDVVDRLNGIEGLARIRLGSTEPTTLSRDLFPRMADTEHALVPFLHISAQSGSDAVLKRMNRPYRRQQFLEFIRQAADAVPDIGLGTDLMVGMPGETDHDSEQSCDLLKNSPLTYAHVFKYSPRPGTPAAAMPNNVPSDVMNERSAKLRALSHTKLSAFLGRFVGRTLDVLFEEEDTPGVWAGHTGNYLRVTARSAHYVRNQVHPVHIDAANDEQLEGTFIHGH